MRYESVDGLFVLRCISLLDPDSVNNEDSD